MKYNIGDKVKIIKTGLVSTIIEINEKFVYPYRLKDVVIGRFIEDDLELIEKLIDETNTKIEHPKLETGDKVTLRNGKEYIVTDPEEEARPIDSTEWTLDLYNYNDELQSDYRDNEYEKLDEDIMIISKPEYKVTWTRTEKVRKITRTEIENIIGSQFEIIEEE